MSLSRRVNKQTMIHHTMEYYSGLKINELLNRENICMKFKCILLIDRASILYYVLLLTHSWTMCESYI